MSDMTQIVVGGVIGTLLGLLVIVLFEMWVER